VCDFFDNYLAVERWAGNAKNDRWVRMFWCGGNAFAKQCGL